MLIGRECAAPSAENAATGPSLGRDNPMARKCHQVETVPGKGPFFHRQNSDEQIDIASCEFLLESS